MDIKQSLQSVLREEANALNKCADIINQNHTDIVKKCYECEGKIVLTGIGKSGHVARKISATLSSLGSPSIFLHPAEAAHGDLGMVEQDDIVIMMSKSGETEEMIQLVNSFKVIGCYLIGVFGVADSLLEKYCDLTVVLPVDREVCVNDLAPTTSTTLMMAFGDALAVTLSQLKKFSKQDFALFHPKGTLGKRLLLTSVDLAYTNVKDISVHKDDEVNTILWIITKNRLGAVAVVNDNGELVGLVSDGDIRRGLERNLSIESMIVSDIMTVNPISSNKDTLAVDAFKIMKNNKISVLPLTEENGVLVGMVSFYNIVESGITGGI